MHPLDVFPFSIVHSWRNIFVGGDDLLVLFFICLLFFVFFSLMSKMLDGWNLLSCQAIHIVDILTDLHQLWATDPPEFSKIQEKLYLK